MSTCFSVLTVAEFNPIKLFFTGGANKKSYESHSWKYQYSGAAIIQPDSQQSMRCFFSDSVLLWALSAKGSEIKVPYKNA